MFYKTTFCKSLFLTAISLALTHEVTGINAQESKTTSMPDNTISKTAPHVEVSKVAAYNTCSEKTASNHHYSDLMLVSTLDGRISALDLQDAGSVQWTLDTDIGPLMDASISNFEVIGPDGNYKVIPSLDGGLFRWNGQNVEPVPLDADTLLSSSFKLSEDAVMVGGKETSTYGINAGTGQILYVCGVSGCQVFEENESTEKDNIIVIERVQRTCRAVEQRTGVEKWNFSVGQHEVSYLPGKDSNDNSPDYEQDEDYQQAFVCVEETEEEQAAMRDLLHPVLKVFISPGTVFAYSQNDPTRLLWKQEFSSAIAAAWTIKEGKLEQVNLFDVSNIPLIGTEGKTHLNSDLHPVLFLGEYNNQAYVHPSNELQRNVRDMTAAASQSSQDAAASHNLIPRVQWRPYMSTALSRTPILSSDHNSRKRWVSDNGAVTVWSQYPFDLGYYVLPERPVRYQVFGSRKNPLYVDTNDSGSSEESESLEILLSASAMFWWKEILAISLILALGMQFLCLMLRSGSALERISSLSATGSVSMQESMLEETSGSSENQPKEYKSRYLTDFEHQACLGKGGFGIVFEAKNVIDENSYAIKRICLPNRTKAREKVLREARALARLDHSGIVRYFNSWLEEPPAGWQKTKDMHLLGDSVNSSHDTLLSHSTTANFNKDSLLVRDKEQFLNQTGCRLHSSIKGDGNPDVSYVLTKNKLRANKYHLDFHDESGSFSIEFRDDSDNGNGSSKILMLEADDFTMSDLEQSSNSDLLTPVNSPLYPPFDRQTTIIESRHRMPCTEEKKPLQGVLENGSSCRSTSGKGGPSSWTCPSKDYSRCKNSTTDLSQNTDSFQIVFGTDSTGDKERSQSGRIDSTKQSSTSDLGYELSGVGRLEASLKEPTPCDSNCSQAVPRVYLYIQMQLCQKETLKDWLGANTLSRDRVKLLHIFQQILAAVQYVHACGMIHRDLKPSNIFFSVDGTVKVGDFGLVTAVDTQLDPGDSPEDDLTNIDLSKKHTSQVGTQLYMSPEQLCGQSYDHKVDIFSLGLIFFELLHPFSTQMERIMVMTGSRQKQFPLRFEKELPIETELIRALLSNNPAERPDADEIAEKKSFRHLYKNFIPPLAPNNRGRYSSSSSN